MTYLQPSLDEAVHALSLVREAYDEKTRPLLHLEDTNLYIVFKGTDESADWVTNLRTEMIPFRALSGAKVHQGFYWEFLKDYPIDEVRKHLSLYPGSRIIVAGHSLGGAIADLTALAIAEDFPGSTVCAYTYGAPRVGNHVFVRSLRDRVPSHLRVTLDHDIVPLVPPVRFGFRQAHGGLHLASDGHPLGRLHGFWGRLRFWLGYRAKNRKDHWPVSYLAALGSAADLHLPWPV